MGYILFLGPVWGDHLQNLSTLIKDRAQFLESIGGHPHPILENYHNLNSIDRWRCGALLGALFFSLPLALSAGFVESTARLITHPKGRWLLRLSLTIPWLLLQGGLVHHFAISPWVAFYGWAILISLPIALGEGLQNLLSNLSSRFPKGSRLKTLSLPILILLPTLFHPVWDLFLSPRQYADLDKKYGEGTSASIKLTSARDWFLLNNEGQHWFNSWYYSAAPLLMERERITNFQPMVVAMVGIDPKKWSLDHLIHFASKNNDRGQRIHLYQTQNLSELDGPLLKDQVDYVALSPTSDSNYPNINWPAGSYGIFSPKIWKDADGKTKHDNKTFWSKKEKFPDGYFYHTPLIERRQELRKLGLNDRQSALTQKFKTLLFEIQSTPSWMGSLGLFGALGFLVFLAWILSPIARKRPSLFPILGLALTLLQFQGWSDAFHFRISENDEDFWSQHEVLKKASFTLGAKEVEMVLQQPTAEDARLRILQWLVMGRAYPTMPKEIKSRIEKALAPELENFLELPFNLRYKLLDACSGVTPLHQTLKEKVLLEKHPYVRWYAREKGFDEA